MIVSQWFVDFLFSVLLILLCRWFYFSSVWGGLLVCIMKNSLICLLCLILVIQLWYLRKLCLVMMVCVILFMCVCRFIGVISRMFDSVCCIVLSGVIMMNRYIISRIVGLMQGISYVQCVLFISQLLMKVIRQVVDMLVDIFQFLLFSVMNFELMLWLVWCMNRVSLILVMIDSIVNRIVGFNVIVCFLDINVFIVLIVVYRVVLIISVLLILSMIGFRCQKFIVKCWLRCDCNVFIWVDRLISCIISNDSQVIIMLIRLQMLLKMISEELVRNLNIIVVIVIVSDVVMDRCSIFCLVVGLKLDRRGLCIVGFVERQSVIVCCFDCSCEL